MNLANLHTSVKAVSAVKFSTENFSSVVSINLKEAAVLDKHLTKTPALLLCITGKTIFENEKGEKHTLTAGDYVNIEPHVIHWLTAKEESDLVLLK
jgi:quercetin dioxygenase-like cupin family protein